MSANRKTREREEPAAELSPPPAAPAPHRDTFDAAVTRLREAIENAAIDQATRVGAFLIQHSINVATLVSNGLRGAAVVFFLLGFPYSAWGSVGELMIRSGSPWGLVMGLLMVVGPIVGAFAAILPSRQTYGPAIDANVVQFPPPTIDEPGKKQEPPPAAENGSPDEGRQHSTGVRAALMAVAAWLVLDVRFLNRGLFVYILVVVGGAVIITVVDLTLVPSLGQTYLAQLNRMAAHAVLAGLNTVLDIGVWLLDLIYASVADAWNRIWH